MLAEARAVVQPWLSVFSDYPSFSLVALSYLATLSFPTPAALLEQVRQRLQHSLALPIVPQQTGAAAELAPAQLWQLSPSIRVLAKPPGLPVAEPRPARKPPPEEYPTLWVYSYVSDRRGEQLRAQGTYYADAVGNAWFRHPELLVSVQGHPRPTAPAPAVVSPALQVQVLRLLFQLVLEPALATYPVPHLAAHTQLPVAAVRRVLGYLTEQGLWQEDASPGRSPLLPGGAQYWAAHYAPVLRRRLNAHFYSPRHPADLAGWPRRVLPATGQWSGEAAAHLLLGQPTPPAPASLTLYSQLPRTQVVQQLDLVPNTQGPIEILNAFAPSSCFGLGEAPCVPPLLVYADLLASQRPPAEALAQQLRTTLLADLGC
jgi:hypothetical protein